MACFLSQDGTYGGSTLPSAVMSARFHRASAITCISGAST
ncbi:hypothetical protein BH10PSE11_BH10PSE11_20930 [soil metagenome]